MQIKVNKSVIKDLNVKMLNKMLIKDLQAFQQ